MSKQIIKLDDFLKSCIENNQSIVEIALLTLGSEIITEVEGIPQLGHVLINRKSMPAIILRNKKGHGVYSLMQEEPLLSTTVANGQWNGYKMFELCNSRGCYEVGIKIKENSPIVKHD